METYLENLLNELFSLCITNQERFWTTIDNTKTVQEVKFILAGFETIDYQVREYMDACESRIQDLTPQNSQLRR